MIKLNYIKTSFIEANSLSMVLFIIFILPIYITGSAHAQDNVEEPERQWGPATGGARFSISTDKEEYRAGEAVRLEMITENVSDDETLVVAYTNFVLAYRFEIILPNGGLTPLTNMGYLSRDGFQSDMRKTLEPGQSETFTTGLNWYYDMTLKGEYTITAYRRVGPNDMRRAWEEVPSNTLKITILGDIRDDVEEEFEAAAWGPVTRGVRMSIMLDKQKLRLRIITENVGEESVRIARISSDHSVMLAYRLDVRRADGIPLPLTLEGQRLRGERSATRRGTIKLDPGETDIYITPPLNSLFDMTTARRDYYVTIYRDIMLPGEDPPWVEVQSNTLKTR